MGSKPSDKGQTLERLIVDDIVRGLSIERVAFSMGLTTQEVAAVWRDYVENKTQMSFEEQTVLYSERLDKLLSLGYTILERDMDADSVNAVARVLQQIEELQSLNLSRKEKLQKDVVMLTKQQTSLMLQVLSSMSHEYEQRFKSALENNRTIKAIKADILDEWTYVSQDVQLKALEAVKNEH